ncbi:MAG: hypothetical protein NXH78_08080 [Hyphomonadaceae bacterium]|nr:hypothetical protein [Hyphomonadaceae bacterium]
MTDPAHSTDMMDAFIDEDEFVLWRSRPIDRLRRIVDARPKRFMVLFSWLYFLGLGVVILLVAWIFAQLEFPGHLFIATVLAAVSVIAIASALIVPVLEYWTRGDVESPHENYILTSHRFLIVRADGTSISIYPDAIVSIESRRVSAGYHVVMHLLSGQGPFQDELTLSRFQLAQSEALEKRLITWKNQSQGIEHHEQTH